MDVMAADGQTAGPASAPLELIRLAGVSFDRDARPVDLDLTVRAGDFVALLGPADGGRDALLDIIGGRRAPATGRFFLNGTEYGDAAGTLPDAMRTQIFGYLRGVEPLDPGLTIEAIVAAGLDGKGANVLDDQDQVLAAMDRVAIAHRAGERPAQLDLFQQRRAAIAHAIVGNPQIVIMDEPTFGLDQDQEELVLRIIDALTAEGYTIVIATSSARAARIAGRTIRMPELQRPGHSGDLNRERRRSAFDERRSSIRQPGETCPKRDPLPI